MSNRNFKTFFLGIVVPSILAITLFMVSFYMFIIPLFEQAMLDRKKEMILELTNTAWSIMEEHNTAYENGRVSLEKAQKEAAAQIEQMRYGPERKDYFWIIDMEPRMMMHPYRKELNNKNLSNYEDSHENRLFVDAVNLIKEKGEGFLEYYWQWKDDTTRVVPKLSYVKEFKEWNWIVGTGIYMEDVRQELSNLKQRLFIISTIIICIIGLALFFIVRQSLLLERKRQKAEAGLRLSRQKYKSLVEASSDGTLMIVKGKVVFANVKFTKMLNRSSENIENMRFDDIFEVKWEDVNRKFTDPKKSISFDTFMLCGDNTKKEIIISVSKINYSDQQGVIVVAKDITKRNIFQKEARKLSMELQSSLQLMNQPIKVFVRELFDCELNTSIAEAARIMASKSQKIIFIRANETIIGVVNDSDIRNRVIAKNKQGDEKIQNIMSAPVSTISSDALLYEAILTFKKNRVSHLLVTENGNTPIGYISNQDCLEMQRNSLSYLAQEIEASQRMDELNGIYNRLPVMINSLVTGGDSTHNISRITTSVADAITRRVIELVIEKIGAPPCRFVFLAMGSEGRSEQTLKTDQDNAIVYEEGYDDSGNYFLTLGQQVNRHLDYIGYKKCPGNNMAGNPKWCQSLSVWKTYFTGWTKSPDPQNILDSSIFFDFRAIYGEREFATQLHEHIAAETHHNGLFFYHMSKSIVQYKPTLENNTLNLKKVMLPVVGYLRTYALHHKLYETNSLARLDLLEKNGVLNKARKAEIEHIFTFLMQLRIKTQVSHILINEPPENVIDLQQISGLEESTLKKVLTEVHALQVEMNMEFSGTNGG